MEIALFALFIIIALCFPRFTRAVTFLIFAPLCGFFCGTFAWGLVAMFNSELITLRAYGTFLLIATIICEAVIYRMEVGK